MCIRCLADVLHHLDIKIPGEAISPSGAALSAQPTMFVHVLEGETYGFQKTYNFLTEITRCSTNVQIP